METASTAVLLALLLSLAGLLLQLEVTRIALHRRR